MTSFKTAQEQGLKWPLGPDDMCPSKIENVYLYGGGRTDKLKRLLGGISVAWIGSTWALDKYLTRNRARVGQNYLLERVSMNSVKYMWPVMFVLWVGLPISQSWYWWLLDVSVGARPTVTRNPRPNWEAGQGILDRHH